MQGACCPDTYLGACLSCLPFLPGAPWGSGLSLHSRRPILSWGSLRASGPHISWFSSRSL